MYSYTSQPGVSVRVTMDPGSLMDELSVVPQRCVGQQRPGIRVKADSKFLTVAHLRRMDHGLNQQPEDVYIDVPKLCHNHICYDLVHGHPEVVTPQRTFHYSL